MHSREEPPGPQLQQVDRTYVVHQGRRLSYFGGSDYFRMSSHPEVKAAFAEGARKYGLNVAASRTTTGNHPLYHELESRLAAFFDVGSATLVSSGYMAAFAAAQALAGEFSCAFIDDQAHTSLKDAVPLLKARIVKFMRGDAGDLRRRLAATKTRGRVVVISEGLYGHNGQLAPLVDYLSVLPRSGLLLVDEAHSAGTLGATGKGAVEECKLPANRVIRTITLSKAFGAYGGAVIGPRNLQKRVYAASVFIGNTPLPPPLASAALKALMLIDGDLSFRQRLRANTSQVKDRLQAAGLDTKYRGAPLFGFEPARRNHISAIRKRLLEHGVFPSFIRYPGGPPNGYFRFAISSEHTHAQLDALVKALTG